MMLQENFVEKTSPPRTFASLLARDEALRYSALKAWRQVWTLSSTPLRSSDLKALALNI